MEQRGLSVKDLVPMIGDTNRIYEVLNRKRPLSLKVIWRLHKSLGIPAESLIRPAAAAAHAPAEAGRAQRRTAALSRVRQRGDRIVGRARHCGHAFSGQCAGGRLNPFIRLRRHASVLIRNRAAVALPLKLKWAISGFVGQCGLVRPRESAMASILIVDIKHPDDLSRSKAIRMPEDKQANCSCRRAGRLQPARDQNQDQERPS